MFLMCLADHSDRLVRVVMSQRTEDGQMVRGVGG